MPLTLRFAGKDSEIETDQNLRNKSDYEKHGSTIEGLRNKPA